MPPVLPTMSRNQCAPVGLAYNANLSSARWANGEGCGLRSFVIQYPTQKICERFREIGFNGVMPTLAYVTLNQLLPSSSNMAGLLWRKRLTTSRFTLIAVC